MHFMHWGHERLISLNHLIYVSLFSYTVSDLSFRLFACNLKVMILLDKKRQKKEWNEFSEGQCLTDEMHKRSLILWEQCNKAIILCFCPSWSCRRWIECTEILFFTSRSILLCLSITLNNSLSYIILSYFI